MFTNKTDSDPRLRWQQIAFPLYECSVSHLKGFQTQNQP